MFNLEFGGNGDTHAVTPELIKQSIETLDTKQRDFITKCLEKDPQKRPTAKELLFHPLLFEVPTLRLLAAHQIIKIQNECGETNTERIFNDSDFRREPDYVIASTNRFFNQLEIKSESIPSSSSNSSITTKKLNKSLSSSASNSTSSSSNSLSSSPTIAQQSSNPIQQHQPLNSKYFDFKYSLLNQFEANKYFEDVKNGIYPLTAYGLNQQTQELLKDAIIEEVLETILPEPTTEMLPSSFNDQNTYHMIRTSLSPSTRSLSGTNTSLVSTNLSSASSSSSTSPSQSLSQVVLQQNSTNKSVNQQQQAQNYEHINYQKTSYSPPVSNLILNNNLMLNNISQSIQNSTNSLTNNLQSHSDNNGTQQLASFDNDQNKSKKLFVELEQEINAIPPQFVHQYQNQVSSSNSSTAPTPTPLHQQQFFYNSDSSNMSKYTSPSASPPPPQVQPYQNGGTRSLSKSPVRNVNGQMENNNTEDQNNNLEWRHAEKMEFYLAFIEKYNNYKVGNHYDFNDFKIFP